MGWKIRRWAGGWIVLVFMIITADLHAGYDFNRNCREAMRAILDLRFDDAALLIAQEKKLNPDNGYVVYLEHYSEAIALIITEEPKIYGKLIDSLDGRLARMEKLDRGTPDFEWLKAEMLFHAGLAQVWFGSRVSGAAKIFGSYRRIREHRQLHPEFWQNLKLAGMFNVMFDFIPTWMRRAADMFGLSGNSVLGMYQIETYCDSAAAYPGLAEESILITGLGYKMNAQELKGMDFLQRQPAGVMENTLIRYLYASAATYTYQNDLALEILGGIRENDLQMRFYSLDYITGRCMLNKLEPGANVPLERYLADYPGQDYRKDICFRLSCYYLIRGNHAQYRYYHELIATTGETMRDRDQEALLEYRSGVVPHTDLLRARLLCDGGYYDRALAELSAIDPPELTETAHRLEFHYRKGRIYQQSGRNAEAIAELTRAYGNGKSLPYTFATRAALNLGRIYEESGDYRLAFDWYEHASRAWSEEHSAESVKDAAERGMERVKGKF